jgi:CheY-like chemotaxis protein
LPSVLLVDDDQTLTSLLKTLLELEPIDFDVRITALGSDALREAETNPPQLIMVDYHLKDMDGLQLVAALRASAILRGIPIVMASGMDIHSEAISAGVDKFILKPFEPGDLPGLFLDLIGQ